MAEGVVADHRLSHVSTASSTNSKRTKAHIGPWQLGRTLGRGSSGRVRLAKHNESGKLAAVKIVPKSQIVDPSTGLASKNSETFGIEREVIIMKLIEHPNIMTLYDVWENKGELYLVLEYIEGGELFDYLISRGRLSEREAIHYFRQICYGVDYCHKFNICHRDLKPENLLLDTHRNIKIADFGMAALESNGRLLETSCGSPHYASPEIVTGKTYHGAPSDIWSCGIILFALLTGHLPFDDDNIRQLLLKVQAGKFSMPSSLSLEAQDLISRMLVVNPKKRITMREIFAHPLLAKYPLRRVPIENIDRKTPKVDVTQPISRIDPEILRNLQTLWHHDSREYLINRLKRPEPNTEKTFYSLLLRFRQRHGLSSRESLPRNRSAASIRSLRSSKSVRSLASLTSKPGSMKSLKSVRSSRSGKSLVSRRRARYSPVKSHHHHHHHHHNHHHKHHASSRSQDEQNSAVPAKQPGTQSRLAPINQKKNTNDNTDVFAQLLDQAFNQPQAESPQSKTNSEQSSARARPVTAKPPANHQSVMNPAYRRNQPDPSKMPAMGSSTRGPAEARAPKYSTRPRDYGNLSTAVNGAYPAPVTKTKATNGDRPAPAKSYVNSQNDARAGAPAALPKTYDNNEKRASAMSSQASSAYPAFDINFSSIPMDFGLDSSSSNDTSVQGQNNYLLPMIFEEDRFADAIEEEMDLKVYNRKGKSQQQRPEPPAHAVNQKSQGPILDDQLQDRDNGKRTGTSGHDDIKPKDDSQLRIHNLVAGESLLSYNPSPAAASISAPTRPAPRAPSGPRAMSSQHSPVPIYVESDSDSPKEEVKAPAPTRQPLAPLSPEDLKRHRISTGTEQSLPRQRPPPLQQPQQPEQQLKLPKRGDTAKQSTTQQGHSISEHQPKEKKSWIRRLTPRIVSRLSSKHESTPPVSRNSAAASARAQSMPNASADKENYLHGHNQIRRNSAMQGKQSDSVKQRQSSFEEPRQNWFMKFLTASTQTSSRTLMSTCQPIELRAIILEVLSEWMPHGLAAYSDGSRGEPISVAILRNNSLKLKPARISIDIKPSYTTSSSAHLVHESGARSSFFTFAGELERRLGENNVLGV